MGEVSEQPRRYQRKRGEKLPDGVVYVGRPTVWGNPYKGPTREAAIADYRQDLEEAMPDEHGVIHYGMAWAVNAWLSMPDLRGKSLACWCPLVDKDGQKVYCHADVLLELANKGVSNETNNESSKDDQGREGARGRL